MWHIMLCVLLALPASVEWHRGKKDENMGLTAKKSSYCENDGQCAKNTPHEAMAIGTGDARPHTTPGAQRLSRDRPASMPGVPIVPERCGASTVAVSGVPELLFAAPGGGSRHPCRLPPPAPAPRPPRQVSAAPAAVPSTATASRALSRCRSFPCGGGPRRFRLGPSRSRSSRATAPQFSPAW